MHINDIIGKEKPTISFEFFPPKTEKSSQSLFECIKELEDLDPSFVSITYGAGGSTRELTHGLVVRIKDSTSLTPVPHLTCVNHTEEEILSILEKYAEQEYPISLHSGEIFQQDPLPMTGQMMLLSTLLIWSNTSKNSMGPENAQIREDSG